MKELLLNWIMFYKAITKLFSYFLLHCGAGYWIQDLHTYKACVLSLSHVIGQKVMILYTKKSVFTYMNKSRIWPNNLRLSDTSFITDTHFLCDREGIHWPLCALRHVDICLLSGFKSSSLTWPFWSWLYVPQSAQSGQRQIWLFV